MITTFTGQYVNPLDLHPEHIHIEDIAHSLALINRFVGHTKKPLSVAQHCVMAARMLEGTPFALQGLLHDGSEAYLGDVSRWVKASSLMTHYREVEDRVQRMVFQRFGVWPEMHPAVVGVDNLLVRLEGEQWVTNWDEHIRRMNRPGYGRCDAFDRDRWKALGGTMPWNWDYAEQKFLETYRSLCPHTVVG